MGSLALTALTITLGMFFIFVGQFKITPQFFPEVHEDMVNIIYSFTIICIFMNDIVDIK